MVAVSSDPGHPDFLSDHMWEGLAAACRWLWVPSWLCYGLLKCLTISLFSQDHTHHFTVHIHVFLEICLSTALDRKQKHADMVKDYSIILHGKVLQ